MRARTVAAILIAVCGFASVRSPADAASAKINSFTTGNSGSIAFTVAGLTNALAPGSQSYSYSLNYRASPTPGTISITAPALTGTSGNSISPSAFHAACAATSDPNGSFTSSGTIALGASAVTCGTLAANSQETLVFTVTLYIDETPSASSFTADTYTSALMSVTVNMP